MVEFHPRAPADIHAIVLDLIPRSRGAVLDAAAGDGHVTRNMIRKGFDVTSVDVHFDTRDGMPDAIEANLNERLPFADERFDGIVSIETIEHLENPWFFVRELARVTRPGGFVIITSPNVENVQSRLLMLLEGQLVWFRPHHVDPLGHITPIFSHLLDEMTGRVGLTKQTVRFSQARIPKTAKHVPFANNLVGEVRITKFIKT